MLIKPESGIKAEKLQESESRNKKQNYKIYMGKQNDVNSSFYSIISNNNRSFSILNINFKTREENEKSSSYDRKVVQME